MFRRTLILVLALSVAGCLDTGTGGVSPESTATQSPTATPETTASTTGSPTVDPSIPESTVTLVTDCPYLVSADPVSDERADGERLAYESMTAAHQQAFRNALNDTIELETLPERWPAVVSYEGEQYQIRAAIC